MSIENTTPKVFAVAKTLDRTWRSTLETGYGTDYTMTSHRERLYLDDQGQVIKREELPDVVRAFSKVASDPEVPPMVSAIRNMIDKWAVEDGIVPPVATEPEVTP